MDAPILVTGGTGRIGRRVVPLLTTAGRDVRILTRHPGTDAPRVEHVAGDVHAGLGLAPALAGVDVVLHLAGGPRGDDVAAGHLAAAARAAGVKHLVLISVVGAGRMPVGYFRTKAACERILAESGVPWTVLRAAQLHDLVLPIARGLSRLPVLPAPGGVRAEPVDVAEVAARLAEATLGAPAGLLPDAVGPEVLDVPALVAAYRRAHGARPHRVTLAVRLPGAVGRAYGAGDNLAGPDARRGGRTWAEFLAADAAASPAAAPEELAAT